jgi:hypothetical protein
MAGRQKQDYAHEYGGLKSRQHFTSCITNIDYNRRNSEFSGVHVAHLFTSV